MLTHQALPLIEPHSATRIIAWHNGTAVSVAQFERDVIAVTRALSSAGSELIDLCDDRYHFLVAYAAALSSHRTVLLPASRAEEVVAEMLAARPGSVRCDDTLVERALSGARTIATFAHAAIAPDRMAVINYTSGTTGTPTPCRKSWRALYGGAHATARMIRDSLAQEYRDRELSIVATVPPQHMYGMELSIVLPLVAGMAVHSARPLFPADIALALSEVAAPRVLVTTPVHLRAIVESTQTFPALQLVVSATAPLDAALARAAEARLGAPLSEILGSTETGAFSSRRTAHDAAWRLYAGVAIEPLAAGTKIAAPWFDEPAVLQDTLEPEGADRFRLCGRNADMIDVAGKRASLADLTRRLLAIEGVVDAVVFQPGTPAVAAIRRVAALVVAPGLTSAQILERFAAGVDPVFLPRPLLLVERLPRDAVGKLPREALLNALRRAP